MEIFVKQAEEPMVFAAQSRYSKIYNKSKEPVPCRTFVLVLDKTTRNTTMVREFHEFEDKLTFEGVKRVIRYYEKVYNGAGTDKGGIGNAEEAIQRLRLLQDAPQNKAFERQVKTTRSINQFTKTRLDYGNRI